MAKELDKRLMYKQYFTIQKKVITILLIRIIQEHTQKYIDCI